MIYKTETAIKRFTTFIGVVYLFITLPVVATSYKYDEIGRLTKVTYDNDTSISYQYDDAGNLLSSTTKLAIEFADETFNLPRGTIYQTENDHSQSVEMNLMAGLPFDDNPSIYSVELLSNADFTFADDYINNGDVTLNIDANFVGVIPITYQVLENGIVTTIVRNIVVRGYDSDQDGLPDEWENNGSINGVSLAGAEVGKKDIFLWIDHMYRDCDFDCWDVDYKLSSHMDPIIEAFAKQGIALHVKHGTQAHRVAYQANLETGEDNVDCASELGKTAMRCGLSSVKEQGFWKLPGQDEINKAREQIFHYMLIGDSYDSGTSTGIAFSHTNFIFVAREHTKNGATGLSGTIMHELGHVLGLRHGGPIKGDYGVDAIVEPELGVTVNNFDINYKPNYLSVMNYHFQQSGLRVKNALGIFTEGTLSYAQEALSIVDENNLPSSIECIPTASSDCNTAATTVDKIGSSFIKDTIWCLKPKNGQCIININDLTSIDWQTEDGSASVDVNRKVQVSSETDADVIKYNEAINGKGITRLVSQADWPNLNYTLGAIGDPVEALGLITGLANDEILITEPPVEDITFEMEYRVALSAVRQLAIFKPGDSRSALGYRLENSGNQADSYTVSYQVQINDGSTVPAEAWQVDGPTDVELAPDTNTYLNIAVSAPVEVVDGNEAEIVITVTSNSNANITDQQFGIIRITEEVFDDADGDGIPDDIELQMGTNPNNADADGDGLNDSQDPEPNTPNPVESAPAPASWTDITDLVHIEKTTGTVNRQLRKVTSIVTITNTSAQVYSGDIRVELVSSNLALETDSDGQLENGNHYWDLTPDDGEFSSADEVSKQLNFALSRARLTYEVRVYAKP